ncbi:hypothetical protein KMZ29_03595 [Bradyrhizobium sediminis]|uniref:Uncharacterized protein n=1 Tax=Bradyrhizobium sediminis TaxID=2840469 RepID=A0A975RNJ3_9BRAD|nr:hypothetical protein [Bradyrhizobium sediminis]QWG13813.1 hypothetical protein KMZ29_03595 [Bradyrhizobium sediminis]
MATLTTAPTGKGEGPNPNDRQAFSNWLVKQPRQWSVTIAARAALRVLPLLRDQGNPEASILSAFRATAIARFAARFPNKAVATAAIAAASTPNVPAVASIAATAAADVFSEGRDAASAASAASLVASTAAAAAFAASAAAVSEMFAAVKRDAEQLRDGRLRPEQLASAPLWSKRTPKDIGGAWRELAPQLRARGEHWSVWIDWYDDVLAGAVHAGRGEAQDAAYTDIVGELPWGGGAEAVNTAIARRLEVLRADPDPAPIEGIPSPIAIRRMVDGRIGADAGALAEPTLRGSLTLDDHSHALAACRSRADQLRTMATSPKFQGRSEYAEVLASYLEWLPTRPGVGNILLADGEARVLNKLFVADEEILSTGFAGRLSVLLEDHIGLRPYYPELERHYVAVRTGRLVTPLARDAVEAIRQMIRANTPNVFHESVSPAMDETAKPVPDIKPLAPEDAPPPDPNRPRPPRDPVAEVDPAKSRNFAFASAANRIWEILKSGKNIRENVEGWQATYEQFKPHIGTVLQWLRDFWPGGGDGIPPLPPAMSA